MLSFLSVQMCLLSSVELPLSTTSQMCHLDMLLLRKNVNAGKLCKWQVVSFYSTFEEALSFGIEYVSRIKIGTKRSHFYISSGKDLLAVMPTGFGKA